MTNFNIAVQEAWENQGNSTQFDERIIEEVKQTSGYADLLEACKDIVESLSTLYKDKPQIAGEYFGACLTDRIKQIINKTERN